MVIINMSKYEQDLPSTNIHYRRLQNRIRETIPSVSIIAIRAVENKFLEWAFAIKVYEMRERTKKDPNIEEFIHATGAYKIPSILKQNLNWRFVMRFKYGKGVSFSDRADYANQYCNNRNGNLRAFIICDVIVGEQASVGNNYDNHPPTNIDSYRSYNDRVLVKFDDFTYYPKFIVYYDNEKNDCSPRYYTIHGTYYNDESNLWKIIENRLSPTPQAQPRVNRLKPENQSIPEPQKLQPQMYIPDEINQLMKPENRLTPEPQKAQPQGYLNKPIMQSENTTPAIQRTHVVRQPDGMTGDLVAALEAHFGMHDSRSTQRRKTMYIKTAIFIGILILVVLAIFYYFVFSL